jgi:pimeloyl-ACP methyl ester carboxylesterase
MSPTVVALLPALAAAIWVALWLGSRFNWQRSGGRSEQRGPGGSLRTVDFPAVDGTRLEGWLFQPPGVSRPPIVVMAPGLGGTKDGFLESFAWEFVERGLAVLAFDYRCFGGSDGVPRHWVAMPRHVEDYQAAIAFVQRDLGQVLDSAQLALWGSSFSGGAALVTAARCREVRAVVAQCPFLKTPAHLEPRGLGRVRFTLRVLLDLLPVLPPVYVPLFGRPGEWVFAPSVENPSASDFGGALGSEFWRRLPKPPLGGWENRMLARALATLDEIIPMDVLADVSCSTLLVAAQRDDLVPSSFVEEAHGRLSNSELASFDCGHFDLYVGRAHAENARCQAAFLERALLGHRAAE